MMFLKKLRGHSSDIAWLASNTSTVFGSIIVAELWRGIPFFAVTLLASLQSIPSDVYESCEVDGCGKVRKLFYITLPYLKESIVFATLLRAIWEFNSIDMIFTMTNGGPMNIDNNTSHLYDADGNSKRQLWIWFSHWCYHIHVSNDLCFDLFEAKQEWTR